MKFEYAWTDVWKLGSQGPRMKEEGFGRYNLSVTNTIVVDGPQHERTTTSSYSKEDYGDGYYLLEIYGYYVEKSGGIWKLFYKSASTAIAVNDPERTTDTAYCFDVITPDSSVSPNVQFTGNTAIYGYTYAQIKADVEAIETQTNTYQWYRATKENPSSNGEKIEGAASTILPIEDGYDAGRYYYYLGVTSREASNNDVIQTNHPVTFTVEKTAFTITPEDKVRTKIYDAKPFTQQAIPSVKEGSIVLYSLDCRTWKQDQPYITDAGVLNVKAKVEHPNHETVTIDYTLEIIPRKVTLTSATAKKQYDGKPLTNKTVVVSGEGFVSKEGTTYKVTGTITDVGSNKNTFTYTLYKGTKKENYQITTV